MQQELQEQPCTPDNSPMSFLENVTEPSNVQEPEYKLVVDELFVKLDGVNKLTLGPFKTISDKKENIIRSFINTFRTHIGLNIYPTARLIYPDKSGRLYYIRDVTLARLLVKMYQIPKESEDYQVLYFWKQSYQKSKRFIADSNNLRDLPLRASRIIANRRAATVIQIPNDGVVSTRRTVSVLELNTKLDDLANAKKSNEQIEILKPLLDCLSIPEVRWLLHILLKKSILVRFESYFQYVWHPDAPNLFHICNNLQKTFNYLIDPLIRLRPDQLNVFPMLPFKPQLSLKLTKNYDKLVQDMQILVPMDANLNSLFESKQLRGKFYIEEKMDGDRMILHKRGKHFQFYSRRLKNYSFLYGENYEIGSLTKYLANAFPDKVDSIVLDGEMVAWDFKRKVILPFGTLKSSAIQESVRQYTTIDQYEQQSTYPFFLVFDVLHVNGMNLTNHPLFFRKNILEKLVNPIPNRLEILPVHVGSTSEYLKNAIKHVVSLRSEGIIVKHVQLKYHLDYRSHQWVKVKPEYLEKFGENLDLVVIGLIPGIKNAYMCGLRDNNQVFQSFCTVANGFTVDDYDKIERLTNNKWIKFSQQTPPAKEILFGTKKPVYWIHPRDTIVLEIKARSIDSTIEKTYAVGTTLHNLYCRSIREDKTIDECISLDEYKHIKAKYSKDVEKTQSTNKKRRLAQDSFVGKPLKKVKNESNLFSNFNFILVSDKVSANGERITREELMQLVIKYGGHVTHSLDDYSKRQTIVITEKDLPSCKIYLEKGLDLIRPNWILECINHEGILPLEPIFIFDTINNWSFSGYVDMYGDSYIIHSIVDQLDGFVKLEPEDLNECRLETIGEWNRAEAELPLIYLFSNISFYVIGVNELLVKVLSDRIERFGGKITPQHNGCSFIVVLDDATDKTPFNGQLLVKINAITHEIGQSLKFDKGTLITKIPSVVTSSFITKCISSNCVVDPDDYKFT